MNACFFIALSIGISGFALWAYLSLRHFRREYYRLDFSLLHERYRSRLTVDFMHALRRTLDSGKNSEISKDAIFRSMLFTAIRGTRAMSACIFRVNGDRFESVAHAGLFPLLEGYPARLKNVSRVGLIRAHFEKIFYAKNAHGFAEAVESKHAALVRTFPLAPGNFVPADPPALPNEVIITPVFSGDEIIGAIAIANPRHRGQFTPTEIKLADLLAQQASMAFRMRDLFAVRAEKLRLDAELGIAASVQKMLLPSYIPQAHSIDIAAAYRPAQTIGGDLYDVFDLGGGRIAAIVADVSGHGISAALLMAICRTNFHLIAQNSVSAADLLRRLNRAMAHSFSRGKFLTIVCAFLDTQRNTLSVARAGHERPLLLSNNNPATGTPLDDAKLEFIESGGLAVGLTPPEIFDKAIVEISRPYFRGDALILYTDGLTEERNAAGEEFGNERLARIVKKIHGENAHGINNAIIAELSAFSGKNEFADDLTLVTIRAT